MTPTITRRAALLGLAGAVSLGRSALALAPAPTDKRLVVIILRGAMDGLAAVVPYGDPALAGLRASLLPQPAIGQPGGLLDLGGFYGLHPSLAAMHRLYQSGDMLPVHAVAGHYRSRSHFDAQDYLESGADQRLASGWLNRAVQALHTTSAQPPAISVGLGTPLLARGPAAFGAWAPGRASGPDDATLHRIAALNAHDPLLHDALLQGIAERDFAGHALAAGPAPDHRRPFVVLADTAGRLLAAPDGPRIAALEIGGWDTHQNQARALASTLAEFDAGIDALHTALGTAWRDTAILAVTEFGRTARVNGTTGTDHGTGTVAFLAGGAIAGGRVLSDWPGLGPGRLLDDRDLQPTRDIRTLAKGLLAGQLDLDRRALDRIFPHSRFIDPADGLLRA
jgi:uncharacterized protein (DUF1501 family)